jgi:hypothetical protein
MALDFTAEKSHQIQGFAKVSSVSKLQEGATKSKMNANLPFID